MELIEAIYNRRATRDYTEETVDDAVVSLLIDAAIQAPNAMNRQAWSFVVVTDRSRLRRWSDHAKVVLLASVEANPSLAPLHAHLAPVDFNIFYNAPALIVICATLPDPMPREDCCLAAENLMLAAHGRGLGSCWIGFAEAWLDGAEGRAALAIPEGFMPVAPIIVGHPRSRPPAVPRRPPDIRWLRP